MQRAIGVERGLLANKKASHSESGDVKARRKREREGKSAKESETASAEAVEDEEVEEFFAILKRIHSAMRHIGKSEGGGGGRKAIEEKMRSTPSLPPIAEEKRVEIDLNLDQPLDFDSD